MIRMPKLVKLDSRYKLKDFYTHRLEFTGWPYTLHVRMYYDMCCDLVKQFGPGVEASILAAVDLSQVPSWAFEFDNQNFPTIYLRDQTLTHWFLTKPLWEQWNDPLAS